MTLVHRSNGRCDDEMNANHRVQVGLYYESVKKCNLFVAPGIFRRLIRHSGQDEQRDQDSF
jgi:hypothetical protein